MDARTGELEIVEEELIDEPAETETAVNTAKQATDGIDSFLEGVQASTDYRAELLEVYTQRALNRVFDRL